MRSRDRFYVVGNILALDFVNSVMFEITAENLAAWCSAVGLASEEKAKSLAEGWKSSDLYKLTGFRSRLREIVAELAAGRLPEDEEMGLINQAMRKGLGYNELTKNAEGEFVKTTQTDLTDAIKVAVPIAESLTDLICFGRVEYVRKCANPACVLYFYDTTKNHRRRWCSMAVCGNRDKAAKFYRQKGQYKSKS